MPTKKKPAAKKPAAKKPATKKPAATKAKKTTVLERPLNAYFKAMIAARDSGAASFTYKGRVYKRTKLSNGLIAYKK